MVVDHNSRRLLWAAPGRDKATLRTFFDGLGDERSARITHVNADAAPGSPPLLPSAAPMPSSALIPSKLSNGPPKHSTRSAGALGSTPTKPHGAASALSAGVKNSRYALWKNPENLTEKQQTKLAWIVQIDPGLGRAYYLKEGQRLVVKLPYEEAAEALDFRMGGSNR